MEEVIPSGPWRKFGLAETGSGGDVQSPRMKVLLRPRQLGLNSPFISNPTGIPKVRISECPCSSGISIETLLFFPPDRDAPSSKPLITEAGKSVSRMDVSGEAPGRWSRKRGWGSSAEISYSLGANKLWKQRAVAARGSNHLCSLCLYLCKLRS